MKSLFKKHVIPAALIVTVFASNFLLLSVPKLARADSAQACQGGVVLAIGAYVWEQIKDTLGVPVGPGTTLGNILKNRESAAKFINDCILRPLAQMMVVALIRNIGASIVNWVNTGFEGKPSFLTDFEGTVLNAADQAAGNFIENNTDLGFLCSPFSFQIRIALALKYSQPFNEQVRCTLSNIGDNVSNFADNNGGAGWDNWLKVTAQPQNNVYGAFLIADSELAKRMASAVDVKEKRISLGQGFLDFETCDEKESDSEYNDRIDSMTLGANADGTSNIQVTKSVFDGSNIGTSTVTTENVQTSSTERQCKRKSVKTPGRVIADQLQNEFATGPIQRAVAQEIDQVISAVLNQLAQKAIQGATGLLGLSKKRSSNTTSYIDQYRSRYYGQGNGTSVATDMGAQSELDAYTVASYDDSLALRNDSTNSDVQGINQFTNSAGGSQINNQNNQFNATVAEYGEDMPERNVAINRSSTESSVLNPAGNGNDGVKQTNQYVKGAETSSGEAGGWWEVDLGSNKNVTKINIYPTSNPSAPNGGLGTFIVEVKDASGVSTSYPGASFSQGSGGVLTRSIEKTGRYVRITRQASQTMCEDDYYGDRYSSQQPCVDQPHLAFAELEVIEPVSTTSGGATGTGESTLGTTTNSGGTSTVVDNATATSTLSWNPSVVSNLRISNSSGINQEIRLAAVKSNTGLVTEIALYNSNNQNIPFANVFTNFDVLRGPTGGSQVSSQSIITPTVGTLRVGISISQNSSFSFVLKGSKKAGATTGNYSFISKVSDSTGKVLENKTQRINFVVE